MIDRLGIQVLPEDVVNAYLASETLVDHQYEYTCIQCGIHPPVLVHDVTKKAAFKFAGTRFCLIIQSLLV